MNDLLIIIPILYILMIILGVLFGWFCMPSVLNYILK